MTVFAPRSTSVQVECIGVWLAIVRHDRAPCWSTSLTLPSPTLLPQAEVVLAMDFIETVTLTGARQYILAAVHHAARRVRVLGTPRTQHMPG